MIKNMWAFITIIASIILGFSLMFYIFNREQNFADALINTYYMLYGNVTFPSLDVSQSILAVTVTFMLGVFFLNMLVAILNDSFADTQKLRVLNDAQERLDIMLESVNVRKLFKRCRTRKDKEGYLIFCETVNDYDKDEVESINIEENVKILNESVKESEFNIQTQLDELKGKIMENEQKIEEMQNVMLKKIDELTLIAKQNLPRSHKSSSKIITAELEVVEKNVFSLDNM